MTNYVLTPNAAFHVCMHVSEYVCVYVTINLCIKILFDKILAIQPHCLTKYSLA